MTAPAPLARHVRGHDDARQAALDVARRTRDDAVRLLAALVAIPSVSGDPQRAGDVRRAAAWLVARLRDAGLADAREMHTAGHPLVVASWRGAGPRAPTLLVYGHYDVQPAGAPNAWRTPPFAPVVRDGTLVGRGSSDDKGPVVAHLAALAAWRRATGALPVNVVVLLDGEEEIGSPALRRALPALVGPGAPLRPDVAIVSDTRMRAEGRPALVHALRGSVHLEVDVRSAPTALHAGAFAGAVPDAAAALAAIVASLHDAAGRVAVDGFYDRVRALPAAVRARLRHDAASSAELLAAAHAVAGRGEPGFTPAERATIRPALVVTGLAAGHTGAGPAGIVPGHAIARLNARLVPDQAPNDIARLVEAHVARVAPLGVRVAVRASGHARPVVIDPRHPALAAAAAAATAAFGRRPVLLRSGGSIPIVAALDALGIPTALLGFALPDDGMHGPNEHMRLDGLGRATDACIHFLAELRARTAGAAQPSRAP